MSHLKCFLAWLMIAFASFAHGQEFDLDAVNSALERGRNTSKEITLPENAHTEKGNTEANKTIEYYNSDAFRQKLDSEVSRIRTYFDTGVFPDYTGRSDNGGNTMGSYYKAPLSNKSLLGADERIYILVSTSVPMSTLKNYALAIEAFRDPNVRMLFRGLPKGHAMQKPVMAMKVFLEELLSRYPGCNARDKGCMIRAGVQVDPVVFRRYGITGDVPAIIYARGVRVNDPALSEGIEQNASVSEFYVVRGDAALDYALELFRREMASQGKPTEGLARLISARDRGFYGQ